MSQRKRLIAAAAMATGVLTGAQADESAIQAHCLEKWSGDAMRSYCVEEQRQSAEAVASYSGPIRGQCESEWGSDFHMVLFCIRETQPLRQAASLEQTTNNAAN
ncbi:hypothetical protein SA496_18565 [Pseudomonas sp. JS3066]|jgi:hypothetical protein|uniref:hypothetical protein n=1 Tax=unclassified Pseudomonas TaxID=196821 RepID=UPI000EAA7392|nr:MULTISPECIES: hypothetical protein [unclassified Pseudomonas]AYF90713.1 hypothetical protein D6Z43_27600 [Pseudomonas sp. DY-1]MDH4652785.1 hypothetical protein [Pseudomonas sp. BN606]MRK20570.1 hypothetical protein [Pseudomonas sp. JG-B]WVK91715.1 hypothetical protein SA496_18565 [Pseudomonas sp. JS3066]